MTAEREMLADEIERLVGALGAAETRLQEVMAARQHAGDAWDAVDTAKAAIGVFTVCHRFEIIAALRSPVLAADAVERAYREGFGDGWCEAGNELTHEIMDELEHWWLGSDACAALAALPSHVPADEQVERAWQAYEAEVGRICRSKGFADAQDRRGGIRAAMNAIALPAPQPGEAERRIAAWLRMEVAGYAALGVGGSGITARCWQMAAEAIEQGKHRAQEAAAGERGDGK